MSVLERIIPIGLLAVLGFVTTALALDYSSRTAPIIVEPNAFSVNVTQGPGQNGNSEQSSKGAAPFVYVFFQNGSGKVSPDGRAALTMWLTTIPCKVPDVKVYGFASSAPFYEDEGDERNKNLANSRAEAVAAALNTLAGRNIAHAHVWPTYIDMAKTRTPEDKRSQVRVENPSELITRRARASADDACVG